MQRKPLEVGTLTGVATMVAGATTFVAALARSFVNPAPTPGILLLGLIVGVVLLGGIAAALIVSLIARVVSMAGNFTTGFWPTTAMLMQDTALWISMWLLLWGTPFAVAMSVAAALSNTLTYVGATAVGVVLGLLILVGFRRFLSPDIWRIIATHSPARQVGGLAMVALITVLTIPGLIVAQRSSVFEVEVPRELEHGAAAEIKVRLAGRVINHAALRVELSPVAPVRKPVLVLPFIAEEPGTYVAWLDPARLAPGPYRVRFYFDTARLQGLEKSFAQAPAFKAPQRQVLVRVVPRSTRG